MKKKTAANVAAVKKDNKTRNNNNNNEVEDYFVHLIIPPSIAVQTVLYEMESQPAAIRHFNIGLDRQLFSRNNNNNNSNNENSNNNNNNSNNKKENSVDPGVIGTPPSSGKPQAAPKSIISPFQTPSLHAMLEDDELTMMALPPSSLKQETNTNNNHNHSNNSNQNNNNNNEMSPLHHVYVLYAEKAEAEQVVSFIKRRWSAIQVSIASRSRLQRNTSLVLKGLPNLQKSEIILDALYGSDIVYKPSYVRLHRGERGTYKNVVFVKYKNREEAEDNKLRLEHFFIGPRPLKVEFKKKLLSNNLSIEEEDAMTAGSLQQRVRELRVSNEHEGFVYTKDQLSKEELKLLKQLCQSYDLLFEATESKVTVRRQLGPSKPRPTQPGHR
ncbi:hypothetical protein AGDE_09267 [Angomonas deanei]|uniref:RNA recognition motif. (A.k.a. RRM, RBD, or RNP domain) n=1 Tax=Angomonas deanei TaxID=59799 RepID=A0A7G2CNW7_9TRYP|nr:hypothetical protein AGDE_09267 [Angomonas deanei]CAD2219872.1 hypothetical protein, conserved [Angomonas deanei]|eukprot:EPY30785.1 hypothetical protein AGDE_09267 [Angomonas deanei]